MRNQINSFLERKYGEVKMTGCKKETLESALKDNILGQDLAGKQLEQSQIDSINNDIIEIGFCVYELQQAVQDVSKASRKLKKKVNKIEQKKKEDKEVLLKEIKELKSSNKQQKEEIKQMKKTIKWMGVLLGINNASDDMQSIRKRCQKGIVNNQKLHGHTNGINCIDVPYREIP